MCYICGRDNCCSIFHDFEEQDCYADAEIAYANFQRVHQECFERYWENRRFRELKGKE